MKNMFYSIILMFLVFLNGCGSLVESLQTNDYKKAIEIAKDMSNEDINKKDNNQYPIIAAVKAHQFEVAKILINKGANLNVKDSNNKYFLDIVLLDNNVPSDFIIFAVKKGAKKIHYETVRKLINNKNFRRLQLILNSNLIDKNYIVQYILENPKYRLDIEYITFLLKDNLISKDDFFKKLSIRDKRYLIKNNSTFKEKVFLNLFLSEILKNNRFDYLSFYLENKYPLNDKNIRDIFILTKKNKDNKILNNIAYLLVTNYNNLLKNNFEFLLENNFEFYILLFKKGFKLDQDLLCKIKNMKLDYKKTKLLLKQGESLKNTICYKQISRNLKYKKVLYKWNEIKTLLNDRTNSLSGRLEKIYSNLEFLKNNTLDKFLQKKARNMLEFFDEFKKMQNKSYVRKRLNKLIGIESTITDTVYQKSGPCLFGICAGYNEAQALIKVRIIDILPNNYVKLKIIGLKIKRNSVSSLKVYNELVEYLKNKYQIGDIITKNSVADAINETMWEIHTSQDTKGFSKDFLKFIGVYMSDAVATASTRDTGNWLVYDYMNCDAGILANRLNHLQIPNKSVFDKSYQKMKKNCTGW